MLSLPGLSCAAAQIERETVVRVLGVIGWDAMAAATMRRWHTVLCRVSANTTCPLSVVVALRRARVREIHRACC
jgi:hypothetical protein